MAQYVWQGIFISSSCVLFVATWREKNFMEDIMNFKIKLKQLLDGNQVKIKEDLTQVTLESTVRSVQRAK